MISIEHGPWSTCLMRLHHLRMARDDQNMYKLSTTGFVLKKAKDERNLVEWTA